MKRTTFFTCSIYPDLTRVWYHGVRRFTNASHVDVVIYDCGSKLRPEYFPAARIVRFRNCEHGIKIDDCVRRNAQTPLVFLSDDDSFIVSPEAEPYAADTLLAKERAAAFSYKSRDWWTFDIKGKTYPVMGSYSLVFKPDVIRREQLSFRSKRTQNSDIRKGTGYYDTGDLANEQLILRGYDVIVPDPTKRVQMVQSYSGVSSGFVTLVKRRWFGRGYALKEDRTALTSRLRRNLRSLEHACGIAATIALHKKLFREPPQFADFPTYDELAELIQTFEPPSDAEKAIEMIQGYRRLCQSLEAALCD